MTFWRREDPILSEPNPISGICTVKVGGMWPHQRKWDLLPNFIKVLVGGYGCGKTRQLCKRIIAGALHNAPAWSAVVSPNFPLARRTILPTLVELLDGKASVRQDFSWKWDKGNHFFKLYIEGRPEATILYLSGDNPDNLKGPNLGQVGIDEPFIQDRKVFDQMSARIRDPRARLHELCLTGTPEELNWGYEICEGEEKGKHDVGIVIADTRDNLALPPGYAKRLLDSYDDKTAAAYVSGKFVSLTSGRIYYAFDRLRNVKEEFYDGGAWFSGMDFNVNPMAFCVGWHKGERVHIVDEWEIPNSDTQYACSLIREHYPQVRQCFPDPTGKSRHTNAPGGASDFTWILRSGMIVMAPNEPWPRRDSFNAVNAKLSKGDMTIDPRCKKIIRYMTEHSHENANKQKAMTHLLDSVKYPITYLYPVHRPSTTVSKMSA